MTKISSLTALTGAGVDTANDLLPIVDVSAGASGNKKITVAELITAFNVPELSRDALGTALVAGANITITPNDGADTITIAASSGGAIEVLDEGVSETASVVSFDFTGSGVSANDDGSGNVTITIPGGISTFDLGDADDVDTTGASAGDVLEYDGAEWVPVPPAGWVLAASSAASGSAVNFTGLAGVTDIMVIARQVTLSSSGVAVVQVSVDNGSNYFSTSGNYIAIVNDTGVEANTIGASMWNTSATAARSGVVKIEGANVTGAPRLIHCLGNTPSAIHAQRLFVADTANDIDAVRIVPTAGTFSGGNFYVFTR